MKTLAELKDFCSKNNVKFELNPRYAEKDFYNFLSGEFEKIIIGYDFGMNNIASRKGVAEWQWVWFESIGKEIDDNTMFYFSERYSQVNGKSYKGFHEEWNALKIIDKRMGKAA